METGEKRSRRRLSHDEKEGETEAGNRKRRGFTGRAGALTVGEKRRGSHRRSRWEPLWRFQRPRDVTSHSASALFLRPGGVRHQRAPKPPPLSKMAALARVGSRRAAVLLLLPREGGRRPPPGLQPRTLLRCGAAHMVLSVASPPTPQGEDGAWERGNRS